MPFEKRILGDARECSHDGCDWKEGDSASCNVQRGGIKHTVIEVEADGMFRENFSTHRNLAQTKPGHNDGTGHDHEEPEGRGCFQGLCKSLPLAVVVG